MKRLSILFTFLLCISALLAEIKLPSIIGSRMVLQQNSDANLWGWATPKKEVTISTSWNNKTYSTRSSADGKWSIKIATPQAGGPYTITLNDGGQALTLTDVLIGEVWLCSGQSNMQMPMKGFFGQPITGACDAVMTASANDDIRLITVVREEKQTLMDDCRTTSWLESTPANVSEFSATAYYFARYLKNVLKVPVGVICSAAGGTNIERWMDKSDYLTACPGKTEEQIKEARTANLYNTMIHPLIPFTIKGAIWYQGESNVLNAHEYKQLFATMVAAWRKKWGLGDFPFYYVQIAPHQYSPTKSSPIGAAEIRQAQLEAMAVIPNSGMAVTSDVGNPSCIHPADKPSVSKRLALWALARTYGIEGMPYCSPIYKSAEVQGNKVTVSFDHAEMGLFARDKEITGFEVAGADGIYYPAKAVFREKNTKIEVTSDKVQSPVYLQLGFLNFMPLNLYSTFELPVSPFRVKVGSVGK